ncbi:MAG: D-alanyl-D-alanine carboxypeptidase [Firmicutes bacterium]|nr:D-alanyl-D-alanine carboxypeptidase [Bacillota bacterium]
MKKRWKQAACVCMAAGLLAVFVPAPRAAADIDGIEAKSAILMSADTGAVLYDRNSHEKRACGSVTKVMSLLLFMEALDSGQVSLTDEITVSEFANSMGGSEIWLEVGEVMTFEDLLRSVVIQSANDSTVALAEHVAGSEEAFLNRMNERAAELGMNDTHYLNTTGFDEEGQYTTAYDIALAARELTKHEKIFDYTTIWMYDLRGGKTQLTNTNKLIKTYPGITGLKTGTTDNAGNCFCGTAERDGLKLISVVLGCENSALRFSSTTKLLDYGFANWSVAVPELPEELLQPVPVLGGMERQVEAAAELDCAAVLVPKGAAGQVTYTAELQNDVEAPVEKGQLLGTVRMMLGEEELCSFAVRAASPVEPVTFASLFSIFCKTLVTSSFEAPGGSEK